MAGGGSELQAKMKEFRSRVDSDSDSCIVHVARNESPARTTTDVYRSGWCRPPQVTPPLSFVPVSRLRDWGSTDRPSSVPGTSRGTCRAGAIFRCNSSGAIASDCPQHRSASLFAPVAQSFGKFEASSSSLTDKQRRGLQECDSDSESVKSLHSIQSVSTAAPGHTPTAARPGPHHAGWLSKRTSGQYSGRWQRRYFVLEGCILRYLAQPGGLVKRSFDIRRARQISITSLQPRLLQLDFGFRHWRLRADTPEAARRWLLLLEAGRLVAWPTGDGMLDDDDSFDFDAWTDDDTDSNVSTMESDVSASFFKEAPRTPTCPGNKSVTPSATNESQVLDALKQSPAIADKLEIDPEELDKKFDSWLPSAGSADNEVETENATCGGRRTGAHMCSGLENALSGLWVALGAVADSGDSRGRNVGLGPDDAVAALATVAPGSEPEEMGDAIEGAIGEYLLRMQRSLERWVRDSDPLADEVSDTINWLLFEAMPSLERFEAGARARVPGQPPRNWRGVANAIECVLLSEWESRSCDEIVRHFEVLYGSVASTSNQSGRSRADKSLEVLRSATQQAEAWHGHPSACDRATSVLIAALNALLRLFRASAHGLISTPQLASPVRAVRKHRSGSTTRTREKLGQVFREVRGGVKSGLRTFKKGASESGVLAGARPRGDLVSAAIEATVIAEFCGSADVLYGPTASAAVCSDVLAAFTGAFEREGAALCFGLAEVHFADSRSLGCGRDGELQIGCLADACADAETFLEDLCVGAPCLYGCLACEAVVRMLVRRWARCFRAASLRLSTCPTLSSLVLMDETALRNIAVKWGADRRWIALDTDPVQPLCEVRSVLTASSQDIAAIARERMESALGVERGQALAVAADLAASR